MKERIINCSIELFGRYGIKGVTMGAIASELGISKRTLYESFTCKSNCSKSVCILGWTSIGYLY